MDDIRISTSDVEWTSFWSYRVAKAIFQDGKYIIEFCKIPKIDFKKTEERIERAIEQEILHITLTKVESVETSKKWDNIFPSLEDTLFF